MDEYEKSHKDGRVTKWYNIRNEGEELALKLSLMMKIKRWYKIRLQFLKNFIIGRTL